MKFNKKILSTLVMLSCSAGAYSEEDILDNPYQCNHTELKQFIENKMEGISKGVNSGESWKNFKIAYIDAKKEEGDDECVPFWDESSDLGDIMKTLNDIYDGIGDFSSDPGSFFGVLADTLARKSKEMAKAIIDQINKGICERLSEDFIAKQLQDAAGEYMEDEYGVDIDFSDGDIMKQLMDETLCNSAGNNPMFGGNTVDGALQGVDDGINGVIGKVAGDVGLDKQLGNTEVDWMAYGDESCLILQEGSGDPDKPNAADKARQEKADDMVDDQLDKLDAFLWD